MESWLTQVVIAGSYLLTEVWTRISRCRLSWASSSWLRWLAQVMLPVSAAVLFHKLRYCQLLMPRWWCRLYLAGALLIRAVPGCRCWCWHQPAKHGVQSAAAPPGCSRQAHAREGSRPGALWVRHFCRPSTLCATTSGICLCGEVLLQVSWVAPAASALRHRLSCSVLLLRHMYECRQIPSASPALKDPFPAPHSPSSMGGNLRGHSGSTGAPQGSSSGGVIRPQARSWRKGLSSQVGPGRVQAVCTRHSTEP